VLSIADHPADSQDGYADHPAHGFYANGTTSNGTRLGFWTVFNDLEGYTGGPLRSDLVVDTNIYNYYLSNHRGASTLNLTSGFDRIFGPSFVYFNRDADLQTLYRDAASRANRTFAADFYDEVASYIPGYVPSSGRGTFNAKIELPTGASNVKAVLSEVGRDFQDNVGNSSEPF
jgi:rhamnogalacturonan endolyase